MYSEAKRLQPVTYRRLVRYSGYILQIAIYQVLQHLKFNVKGDMVTSSV